MEEREDVMRERAGERPKYTAHRGLFFSLADETARNNIASIIISHQYVRYYFSLHGRALL